MANLSNINNKFLVTTGGNVLIGQTSAVGSSILQVTGDSTFTGNIDLINNKDISMTDNAGAITRVMVLNASNTMYIGPVDTYAGGSILYGSAAGVSYQRWYTGAVERMRIMPSGNVGIGTTSPSSKIDVREDANNVYTGYFYNSSTLANAHGINVQTATTNAGAYAFRVNSGSNTNALVVKGDANVGIGTATPASNTKLDVVGAIKTQTVAHSWYRCGPITSALAYRHIKTNLDMGVGGTNIQYIMGGFEIKGFGYYGSYPGFGHGTCMFHNWSGGFSSLDVQNYAMAGFVQNPYVSSDGFCVIVLRQNTYMQPVIDFCQYYTPYPWRTSVVTAESASANLTGVY